MADVSKVVAHGFGSWSTVNYVPTLGFGIGEAAASHVITMDFSTSLTGESVDGTRKVIATLVPGDAAVVYVFDETEVS